MIDAEKMTTVLEKNYRGIHFKVLKSGDVYYSRSESKFKFMIESTSKDMAIINAEILIDAAIKQFK